MPSGKNPGCESEADSLLPAPLKGKKFRLSLVKHSVMGKAAFQKKLAAAVEAVA